MRHRELGDMRISVVGLGASKFGGQLGLAETRTVVEAALDAGVNFLDTADVYGGNGESERLLGEILRSRRDEVILATKFGMDWSGADGQPRSPPGSPARVRLAAESSLRRLQTDRIDLYQYHLPDGVTPIDETLGALNELIEEGLVRYIGCSNFSAEQLAEAANLAGTRGGAAFVSLQNEYSLLERGIEADVVPACERLGVAILPYFPLASGLLTGKYRRGDAPPAGAPPHGRGGPGDEETFDRLDALTRFARARGLAPVQAAIGGLASQSMVGSVIAGATSPEQVWTNAAAADWEPTAEDLAELDGIFPPPGSQSRLPSAREPAPGARPPRRRFRIRLWRR